MAIPQKAVSNFLHRSFRQCCTSSQHSRRKSAPCSCGKCCARFLFIELNSFLTVYLWRSENSLSPWVFTDSDPPGGFQVGDTSMYPGDAVVNRSIALNEPVIFVSANYRVNGKTPTNRLSFLFHVFPAFGFLGGKEVKEAGITNAGLYDRRY